MSELQQSTLESLTQIKKASAEDNLAWQRAISRTNQELTEAIKVENESTKNYLVQSTNRASAHRETLQVKYDEKLERIKDVCAQYFSKYER